MATSIKKIVGNYADSVYYGVVDSSGYLVGGTATAPVAGNQDGSAMLQLLGVQDFPFEAVDPETPSQPGDGGTLARFINKPTELPSASGVFGSSDYTFSALCQSLSVVDWGGGSFIGGNPKDPTYEDLVMLAISQGKAQDSGSVGVAHWEARLILKANVFSKGRNTFNTSSLPTYSHTVVGNYSEYYPWGHQFAAGDEGDTQFVYLDFTWPYRPILQRYTGDGSETDFNLAKNIAEDSADNIVAFVNGTEQTWVTGVPGAGEFGITEGATDVAVFGTAPANNAKVVICYGWS
jgi:hypothetical protein